MWRPATSESLLHRPKKRKRRANLFGKSLGFGRTITVVAKLAKSFGGDAIRRASATFATNECDSRFLDSVYPDFAGTANCSSVNRPIWVFVCGSPWQGVLVRLRRDRSKAGIRGSASEGNEPPGRQLEVEGLGSLLRALVTPRRITGRAKSRGTISYRSRVPGGGYDLDASSKTRTQSIISPGRAE